MMNKKCSFIKEYFDDICKDAKCTLDYNSDYSLLIAIMLSAQCTDNKVNSVTKKLFSKFKSLNELNNASLDEIENILKSLGLYKNKAIYLKEIVSILLNKYNGVVPLNKEELIKLPGVGNKTANVLLAEWFKIPSFPVDTHVARVSKRLGLADFNDNPLIIEKKLEKCFEKKDWIDLHHKFIFFGRNYCKARNPLCKNCILKDKNYCLLFKNKSTDFK